MDLWGGVLWQKDQQVQRPWGESMPVCWRKRARLAKAWVSAGLLSGIRTDKGSLSLISGIRIRDRQQCVRKMLTSTNA